MQSINEEIQPCCAHCVHFTPEGDSSVCTRNPPTAFLIAGKNMMTGQTEPRIISGWPSVAPDKLCGEFEPLDESGGFFATIPTEENPQGAR